MDDLFRRLAFAKANGCSVVRFTARVELPKSDPRRKTGKFLLLSEACKIIGAKPRTYRRYEGDPVSKSREAGQWL